MHKLKQDIFIFLASLSIFMELFDSTVLFTSLVKISQQFQIEPLAMKSAVINYFIGLSVFISISSYLANQFSEKRVFIFACLTFIVASLACGLSTNATQLALFRFIQGAGAALMTPIAIMMVYRVSSTYDSVRINSLINIPALVGAALGPLLGGIITENFYWGWIFFINVPIGIALIALCLWAHKVNPIKHLREDIKFDKKGFLFIAVILITLSLLIDILNNQTINKALYFSLAATCTLFITLYWLHYKKNTTKTLLDFSLFKLNSFKRGTLINVLARIGISGVAFTIPLFLQNALGIPVRPVGIAIMFIGIGAILSKIFLSNYITRYGFKKSLSFSAIALMASILLFSLLSDSTSLHTIIILCLIYGIINSFQYTAMNSFVLQDIPQKDIRKAININAIFQQFPNAIGICLAAFTLNSLTKTTDINLMLPYKITIGLLAFSCLMTLFIANSKSLKNP